MRKFWVAKTEPWGWLSHKWTFDPYWADSGEDKAGRDGVSGTGIDEDPDPEPEESGVAEVDIPEIPPAPSQEPAIPKDAPGKKIRFCSKSGLIDA